MPVVPAGTLGMLGLRPLPDDFINSPYAALAPIRAAAKPPDPEPPEPPQDLSNAPPPVEQFLPSPAAEPDKLDFSKEPIKNAPVEIPAKGDFTNAPTQQGPPPGGDNPLPQAVADTPQTPTIQSVPLDEAAAGELRAAVLKSERNFQAVGVDGSAFETFDGGESWVTLPFPDGIEEVVSLPVADFDLAVARLAVVRRFAGLGPFRCGGSDRTVGDPLRAGGAIYPGGRNRGRARLAGRARGGVGRLRRRHP